MADIDRDSVKPTAKVFSGTKARQVLEDPKINLLRRVLSVITISQHPPGDGHNPLFGCQHDSLKRERVTRTRARHQNRQVIRTVLFISGGRYIVSVSQKDVRHLSNHILLRFPITTTSGTRKSLRSFCKLA